MKTLADEIEEIIQEHCRYCDQSGSKYQLRCKNDVLDQKDYLLSLFKRTMEEVIGEDVKEHINTQDYVENMLRDEQRKRLESILK